MSERSESRRECIQARWDFRRWKRYVRDPANADNEGTRTISVRKAFFSYRIARVRVGWTVQMDAGYLCGNMASFGTPWCTPLGSRDDAVSEAIARAERHFGGVRPESHAQEMAQSEMLERLRSMRGIFGLNEPAPSQEAARC